MIELFFLKLSKISNDYFITGDDKYRIEICTIFLNLGYDYKVLELINFSLYNDYTLYMTFLSFIAFKYDYNYMNMRYISQQELLQLDTFKLLDIANYDQYELFQYYKNHILR